MALPYRDWLEARGVTSTAGQARRYKRSGHPAALEAIRQRTQQRNALLPESFLGSPNVRGPYTAPPRLNPEQFETAQNQAGRYFARPVTELTGLNPQQRADVGRFDKLTEAQAGQIQGAYGTAAQASEANRAASAAELTALAGAAGAGYAASDPTASVLGQAARQGAVANVTPAIAGLARSPDILRSEGLTNVGQFRTQRLGQRQETIAGYRTAQQEAAAAAREQDLKTMLDLLGIQSDLGLGQLQYQTQLAAAGIQSETNLAESQQRARTADADRAARLDVEAAKLMQQAGLARERNQLDRELKLTELAQNKREKARAFRQEDQRNRSAWSQRAFDMYRGLPIENPDGTTAYDQYSLNEIYRDLISRGAPPNVAREISRQVTGERPVFGATSPILNILGM